MKSIRCLFLVSALLIGACTDFTQFQEDPNRATRTHPSLLLTNIAAESFNHISMDAALASRQMAYTDGVSDEQYYGWQRGDFRRYNQLRQVMKMEEEAVRLNLVNYQALALFFKSLHIMELTKTFGDVPHSEALRGEAGVFTPRYDTQEEIFQRVLSDLDRASQMLNVREGPITGDIIYQGDIIKWKKLVNSFTLRTLLSLSRKGGAMRSQVIERFNNIVRDPARYPIFESNADNAALRFVDLAGNRYPFFNSNVIQTAFYMESSFVNLLRDLQDTRLFGFADLTPEAVRQGLDEDDFNAYGGIDGSALLATNTARVVAGLVSRINPRYYNDPVNEPSNFLSFAEVSFILAEAAARGWINADARTLYRRGIEASFRFYNAPDVEDYLQGSRVVFDPARAIEQIITQKYINYFMNGGWETFFEHRRTGFPPFSVDGGGVLNDRRVPLRWMYPEDELLFNRANVEAAIQRQFAVDDINAEMWMLRN
jgi:hypothetical protein